MRVGPDYKGRVAALALDVAAELIEPLICHEVRVRRVGVELPEADAKEALLSYRRGRCIRSCHFDSSLQSKRDGRGVLRVPAAPAGGVIRKR